jgi:MoxR-like ATPase
MRDGATSVADLGRQLAEQIAQIVVGNRGAVELLTVALLCEGHALIEDVPGIGKTTLAKTLAHCLDCSFARIQFTPDLLPSDITGIFFFNQKASEFEFRAGPIYANVVLADEINRATPRTQSALLEAMEERQVTVEGHTTPLPRPFLVLATQNPVELEGTFPLPEAQLDRFLLRVTLGYPSEQDEVAILRRFAAPNPPVMPKPLIGPDRLQALSEQVRSVHVSDAVAGYAVALARATREHEAIELGASPRASLALCRAAQALAALHGRDFVIPDDLKNLTSPVFGHRLLLRHHHRLHGAGVERVLHTVIDGVTVPAEPLPGVMGSS